MARIIYGVHGTGHGHAIRALAIARMFPEHEFHFVSHDTGLDLLRGAYPATACPNPATVVTGHRVRAAATLASLMRFQRRRADHLRTVRDCFSRFQPDAALTDYECLVPAVARELGVPCLSLDHQHILPLCGSCVPLARYPEYLATVWAIRRLFSGASVHVATSFFPAPRPPSDGSLHVVPPLLRQKVLEHGSREGEHVLAYQGYSTFERFVPFLRRIGRPVLVYGLERTGSEGNLHFKPNAEEEFLRDLAGCRYVICGGGHSLISEALYYGKPVLSFPIRRAIEQWLNAWHVERLGYGRMLASFYPSPGFIRDFESKSDRYRERIRGALFYGNEVVQQRIQSFLGVI
ncbi:MAG TPA: glycosyltransferase family protein [Kiritimatiellia bacterium]|nr:glycosyltransferase family protein [Kiritimatiellia bacterium]HSA17444.1 glycosyltransferase family protein [Kiritimatiellia bacterium]